MFRGMLPELLPAVIPAVVAVAVDGSQHLRSRSRNDSGEVHERVRDVAGVVDAPAACVFSIPEIFLYRSADKCPPCVEDEVGSREAVALDGKHSVEAAAAGSAKRLLQ